MNIRMQLDSFLLLYNLLLLAAFWFYLRRLGAPRLSFGRAWAALAALALMKTVLINNIGLFVGGRAFYSTHGAAYLFLHFGVLFSAVWSVRKVRWDQAFYHALLLFMCTHYFEQALGAATGSFGIFYLSFHVGAADRLLGYALVFFLYLAVSLLLARYVDMRGTEPMKRSRLILISVFDLGLETMNYLPIRIISPQLSDPKAMLGLALLELLCGFTALIFVIYSEIVLQKVREQSELTQILILMEKRAQQYQQQQQTASVIDRKYHDLKRHLNAVKTLRTNEARQNYLAELESSISRYEVFCHTGNEILDTILNEKSLYCAQHDIRLILLVDGAAVSFVHATDLVAIFGNALDNAIEAVASVEASFRREITVRVAARDQWAVLRFENYSERPLVESNGELMTTKQDPAVHGFGFKSISYVAKKYGGSCAYSMEGNLFVLNVLLARPPA